MGQSDTGQDTDVELSRQLISGGYGGLKDLVENAVDENWLKPVNTPFLLTAASEGILTGAMRTAWKLRIEKNPLRRLKTQPSAARCGVLRKKPGKA